MESAATETIQIALKIPYRTAQTKGVLSRSVKGENLLSIDASLSHSDIPNSVGIF
jgi:hypothetical protein